MKTNVLKDKKIMILVQVDGEDADGFPVSGYMPIDGNSVKKWAYYKQLSANLFYQSNQMNVKEECFFRVNYHDYLKQNKAENLYVSFNDLLYKVTRVDNFEGYKGDISLYCSYEKDKKITIVPFNKNLLP